MLVVHLGLTFIREMSFLNTRFCVAHKSLTFHSQCEFVKG